VTVNPAAPIPPYVQVADALRADITAGRFNPGDKIPAIRKLQERFTVSGMTVQSALRVLRDEGRIFSTQRGTFVTESQPQAADPAPSEEFTALSRHLDALEATMEEMAQRLKDLEDEVRSRRDSAPPPAPRSAP
jgi:DNA-binding GntR family transcriptional regulator